ncbi:MAG: hypothetical protein DRP35_03065 [Candidatus Zixiibacteriota bacterium]|nr:MAG: hypothetical protein DRP35_03065 [candidate division Zixibacteria bacterium]
MRRLFSNRGMTIIELLSTVAIIGIVSTMAVPRVQKALDKINSKSGNREMVSSLKLARSMAITDKVPYGVNLGTNEPFTFTLFKDEANLANYTFDDADSVIRVDTLPIEFSTLTSNLSTQTIIFQPNGSVSIPAGALGTSSQIYIVTLVSTQNLLSIHDNLILPATGRVKTNSYYY